MNKKYSSRISLHKLALVLSILISCCLAGCSNDSSSTISAKDGAATAGKVLDREPADDANDSKINESKDPGQLPSRSPSMSDEEFRMAAFEGKLEVVQAAIASGVDVNSTDPERKLTALHMAAYNGHTAVVKLLLDNNAKVDVRDHEGKTPLTHACTGPFQMTVGVLLEGGADINAKETTEGFTPLMMAAGIGEVHVVKVLLLNNADKSIRDSDGDLAIDHAEKARHTDIVKLLD